MHRILGFSLAAALAGATLADAPLHRVPGAAPGRYVVQLDAQHPAAEHAEGVTRSAGGTLVHTYTAGFNGFSARMTEQKALALTRTRGVTAVWEVPPARADDVQTAPSQGLDRIDERDLPLDGQYVYFTYATPMTLYVVDTGVDPRPSEFGTRLVYNVNFWTSPSGVRDPNDTTDGGLPLNDSWHGTVSAVLAAGAQYGVARSSATKLANVRVMRNASDGWWDDVAAGVQWVTQQRYARPSEQHVANLSIGARFGNFVGYPPLDSMLAASLEAGVAWIFSAGNDAADACAHYPAWMASRHSGAMAVGASNPPTDAVFGYSNQGPCVDLYAPSNVEWGDTQNGSLATGTSAAAPFVTGVFAIRWANAPTSTSAEIEGVIKGVGTPGVLSNLWPTSNNLLLYSLLPRRRPSG